MKMFQNWFLVVIVQLGKFTEKIIEEGEMQSVPQ